MHRNDHEIYSNFVMTPKKYSQDLHIPKILFFQKTPKNIEIQNFGPKKVTRPNVQMYVWKYQSTPLEGELQIFQ